MEEIFVIFYVLTSFFGIQDATLVAEKTMVSVNPVQKEITITQENLCAFIQTPADRLKAAEQWENIKNWKEQDVPWANELAPFTVKNLSIKKTGDNDQPQLVMRYNSEKDLRALGIWYNANKQQFAINFVPQQHIETTDGVLEDQYWRFHGGASFSFTIEPFLELPDEQKKALVPLSTLLSKKKM